MVKALLWIWQAPQNIAGIFTLIFNKLVHGCVNYMSFDGVKYWYVKHVNDCAVCLGDFIFLDSDRSISEKAVKHEYGHQRQSKRLGWFYLFVIGIPSAIGNIYSGICQKSDAWYYSQPWEKWADELGGVNRF